MFIIGKDTYNQEKSFGTDRFKILPSETIKSYLEQVNDPYTIIEDGKIRISQEEADRTN